MTDDGSRAVPTRAQKAILRQASSFEHRPALDGLRAIAVYLVVAFHAGSSALQGGFVGVDLFFVLSGFLITSILLVEHESSGQIRVLRFYANRLRRLLPAAIAAIGGASLAMTLVSSPIARSSWIRDAQSALLYVSNWHFIRESQDYFAEAVGQTPFLHFWSLSIEEQFYAFFPLLFVGLVTAERKWPRLSPIVGVSLLAVASLVLQLAWADANPTRAYYGTDTRIYQIAIGACVGFACHSAGGLEDKRVLRVLAPLGLIGLLTLSTSLTPIAPTHRGLAAAFSTACVIVGLEARPGGIVGRVLAIRPLQFLGRISYGTYLWHWPVIVAFTAVFDAGADVTLAISAAVATSIAALSYELLERPVRRSLWLLRRDRLTVVAGGLATVLAAATMVPAILENEAKPLNVVSPNQTSVELGSAARGSLQAPPPTDFDRGNDHGVPGAPERDSMHCEEDHPSDCVVHQSSGPHVLLIGDSHAARLVPAFLQLARDHDFKLSVSALASCRWQLGLAPEAFREEDCYSMRDNLYERLLGDLSPGLIVAVSAGYAPVGVTSPDLEGLPIQDLISRTTNASVRLLLRYTQELLLLEPLPIAGFHVKDCFSAARTLSECVFTFGPGQDHPSSRSAIYSTVYRLVARDHDRVTSAPYFNLTCVSGSPCLPLEDGFATMDDAHHVSAPQAVDKRERLWSILEPILARLSTRSASQGN